MNFKKWVKSIQAAAYNGARTVFTNISRGCVTPEIESKKYSLEPT